MIQLDLTPGVYPRGADRYRRLLRRLATFASHDQRAEVAEMESDKTQQTGESERPPQHDAAAELLRAPDIEAFVSPATAARVRLALAEKCTHLAIGVSAFGTSADEQLAGEFARRARLDAQLAGDIALEAQACDMYASILANAHTPHIAEALALGKEALRLAEASGDRGAYAGAATTVIILYGSSGAGAEAHRLQQRLVEVHEREQNPATLTSTITNLANSAYLLGEWEEAQRLLRRARAICPPHTDWLIWSNVLATDAMLAVAQGRPEADARVGEFLAAVDDQRSAYELLVQLAERDVLQDHPASACSRMEPLLGMHIGPGGFLHHLPQMAWATLVAGDEQGAAAYLQQAEEQLLWPIFRVDLMRVQALVATAQGRWQAAATALEDGLALARTMPYPYAEAKAFFVYGQLHAAKGEREWACEKYQAARAICARLGEGVYRPHIERALHELSTG